MSRKKRETEAVRLLRQGWKVAAVAALPAIDVDPSTVQRWAKKHGVSLEYPYNRHRDRQDLVDVKEILRLRRRTQRGKPVFTLQEVADMCGCSRSYVKQVCAKERKMKNKVQAPFTKEQVASIDAFQKEDALHSFSCDCGEDLVAAEEGLRCPVCPYRQDWVHSFMADWSWRSMIVRLGSA